jgi:hypothetical protein
MTAVLDPIIRLIAIVAEVVYEDTILWQNCSWNFPSAIEEV